MRALLPLLLATAMLLVLLPPAAAQGPSAYNLLLTIESPQEPVRVGSMLVASGKVEVTGDATLYPFGMQGIPVTYHISKAPAWAAVIVEPGSDVIFLDSPTGPVVRGARTFTVSIAGSDAMPDAVLDTVEITATVSPQAPAGAKSVAQSMAVHTQAGEACDEDHAAPASAEASSAETAPAGEPLATPAQRSDDLTVQTGQATPVGTWYALGGFGLAGAGVGAFLWRRRHT